MSATFCFMLWARRCRSAARLAPFIIACVVLCAVCHAETKLLHRGQFAVQFEAGDERIAEGSLDVLEEAVIEFGHWFPLGEDPVKVIIAADMDTFRQAAPHFRQLNVSGVARSDRGEIILKSPRLRGVQEDYVGTVRHELVHILLYRNADTQVLPRWLNEGICMMLANEYRWAATLTVARMFMANRIIPYHRMDFAFLSPGNDTEFGDAYAQALSMTRFLRNKLGDEAFFNMILATRTMSFSEALAEHGNTSPLAFWQEYEGSLWKVVIVGTLTSGSLFGPAALLLIIAYFRKMRSNQTIIDRWEEEDRASEGVELFRWEDHVDGPYEWESDGEDDGEWDTSNR